MKSLVPAIKYKKIIYFSNRFSLHTIIVDHLAVVFGETEIDDAVVDEKILMMGYYDRKAHRFYNYEYGRDINLNNPVRYHIEGKAGKRKHRIMSVPVGKR